MAFDTKTQRAIDLLKPSKGQTVQRRTLGRQMDRFSVPQSRHALILGPALGPLVVDSRLTDLQAIRLYMSGKRTKLAI